ncbi:MAG: exodeoxyribonuclease VII large subunit [Oscillospiraceae bacterium]|nr:exodeoxyribonuclease VII large subunit [Oscillospiraceae bacterium]
MNELTSVTVAELNAYIKAKFATDDILGGIYVKGEISGLAKPASGHIYFTLKDEQSQIKAVMFRQQAERLKFIPGNGNNVLVFCDARVYEKDGVYQLYVSEMQPCGIGSIFEKFEHLKNKLRQEGLFELEHKKPIVEYPARIAAITSKSGAVFRDIVNVLSRRYPVGNLTLIPTQVQGDNAPASIVNALKTADNSGFDTIILARGGGSAEDLQCFNTEEVAYAIFGCNTPVISAVGHETDFTIADFVSDLRAPTPSAAAELAARDISGIKIELDKMRNMLYNYITDFYTCESVRLAELYRRLKQQSPEKKLTIAYQDNEKFKKRLRFYISDIYERKRGAYAGLLNKLDDLSPLAVLSRGFSVTQIGENIIKDGGSVKIGDILTTKVSNASIRSSVIEIKKTPEHPKQQV